MSNDKQSAIQRFLNELTGFVKRRDRGALADLRHGFSETTAHRAWPYVAKYCNLASERDRTIWLTVAAGAATQEDAGFAAKGNLGRALREIAVDGQHSKAEALQSYDGRFRRLLTCATPTELCMHLPGVLKTAARKGVAVNYERLFWDLCKWQKDEIGVQWASHYWAVSSPKGGPEA